MKPTKENTLYLTIKQMYFDQIVEGKKTKEYREIKETTYKKYLEVDEDGWPLYDTSKADAEDPLLGDICMWNGGCYPYVANQEMGISFTCCGICQGARHSRGGGERYYL